MKPKKMCFQRSLKQALKRALERMKSVPSGDVLFDQAGIDKHWKTLESHAKDFGSYLNLLVFSFQNGPLPSAKDALAGGRLVESKIDHLVSGYTSLSPKSGFCFLAMINKIISAILAKSLDFVTEFFPSGQISRLPDSCILELRKVLDACNSIKGLPKTQPEVVASEIHLQQQVMQGFIDQLNKEVACSKEPRDKSKDDEFGIARHLYTAEDLRLLPPAIGLIKTAMMMAKRLSQTVKAHGKFDNEKHTEELDELGHSFSKTTRIIDDLVEPLYPPIEDLDKIGHLSEYLVTGLKYIFSSIQGKHYMEPERDQGWLQVLENAMDHNTTNLKAILIERGLKDLKM